MKYFGDVAALTRKDLLLELRAKETLPAMLLFVLSALTIFHFVVPVLSDVPGARDCETSIADTQQLATLGLLWIALIFTALLGLTRAFVPEREQQTMDVLSWRRATAARSGSRSRSRSSSSSASRS